MLDVPLKKNSLLIKSEEVFVIQDIEIKGNLTLRILFD
jgi:hypothetical protein